MSTAVSSEIVPAEEVIRKANALLPLLRANAASTEVSGNPVPENLAALRDAGLLRLTNPVAYGGLGASARTQVEVIAAIGRGCASTGWITANHAASMEFTVVLPEQGLKEVFAENSDVIVLSAGGPNTRAKRVPGGFRLTGRFPYASGCEISDWALLAPIPVFDGEHQVGMVDALVRLRDVTIERTWQVAGLVGTGTHALEVSDLFVPDHMTLAVEKEPNGRWEEVVSPSELVKGNLHSLSALVGAANGALDLVTEGLSKRRPYSYTTYAHAIDSPAIQLCFAEAAHLVDTAMLHVRATADVFDAHNAVASGTELPWAERARLRMHEVSALRRAREAMQKLLDIAGTGGFALANPIQRYWRDLEIGSRHAMISGPAITEDYSRSLLDLGETISLYH